MRSSNEKPTQAASVAAEPVVIGESEIRLNDDGNLDEIVANNVPVHLEQMDKDHWFLSIGEIQLWLTSKKKITVYYEDNREPESQ
jgi:hypothetical protein